jgi:hypothetical protein
VPLLVWATKSAIYFLPPPRFKNSPFQTAAGTEPLNCK